jgi:DNA-binding protein YbaB
MSGHRIVPLVGINSRGPSVWADDSRPDLDGAEIRERLSELRERLARGTEKAPEPETDGLGLPAPDGSAETPDGLVRAETANGRLQSVRLDGRVMREPAERLGELLTTTCNAALEQAAAIAATGAEPVPDFGVLAEELEAVRNEGLRQMDRMMQGLHDAIEVIRSRAVVHGDVDSGGLEHLLQETTRSVGSLRGPAAGPVTEDAPDGFSAYGLDGLVVVVARSGSRLDRIEIADRAMRHPSQDIGAEVVRAANDALGLARDAALASVRQARSELTARVTRIQDASAAQMTAMTTSLSSLIASIDRP